MAFQHGKNAYLSIDGNDVTAYCDTQSMDRAIALAETTVFGNDDATSIAGVRTHTIQIGGPWDPTMDGYMVAADDGSSVAFVLGPEGNTSGDYQYSGSAFISNYNWQATPGGRVGWSASFTVSGAVTRGTA